MNDHVNLKNLCDGAKFTIDGKSADPIWIDYLLDVEKEIVKIAFNNSGELEINGNPIKPIRCSSINFHSYPVYKPTVFIIDFREFVSAVKAEKHSGTGSKPVSIKNVVFNNPATIVFWSDGTKTVVKAQNNEPFDEEKGLAMAIVKGTSGNKSSYFDAFKKYCKHHAYPDDNLCSEYESMRNQRDNLLLYLQYACDNDKGLLKKLLTTFEGCPGFVYEDTAEKEATKE